MTPEAAAALAALGQVRVPRVSGVEVRPPAVAPADSTATAPVAPAEEAALAVAAEPVYDRAAAQDVQGNVVPGFNKDHQHFLFLRFTDVARARGWLAALAPRLSSMAEVLEFRREFRAERLRTGAATPSRTATWTSVALSHPGLAALLGEEAAAALGEESFRQGLAARSGHLGDPTDPAHPGHRSRWRVGGPENQADALLVIAADAPGDLVSVAEEALAEAARHGLEVVFEQRGTNLPGNLAGHEHFGFKDGVSQPGVRGAVGSPGSFITPRLLSEDDPHADLFARPGQPLVWPGQFLLGEPRQDPADPRVPGSVADVPSWARRGSFLVCRRLAQDVPAFWEFAAAGARELGTTSVRFASLLVGRWPSGAPLSRVPGADDPVLAGDDFANNHFLFDDDTRPSVLTEAVTGHPGDGFPAARADVFGQACPHASHVRKVNPRDSATDLGAPADTFLRLMLRRGIPYGDPLAGVPDPSAELVAAERGLMFLACMSSIDDQFEFVTRRWANSVDQPNRGGHDLVIGQADRPRDDGHRRTRTVDLPGPDGAATTLTTDRDWVVPTGGGYFFVPSISAVGGVLAGRVRGD